MNIWYSSLCFYGPSCAFHIPQSKPPDLDGLIRLVQIGQLPFLNQIDPVSYWQQKNGALLCSHNLQDYFNWFSQQLIFIQIFSLI